MQHNARFYARLIAYLAGGLMIGTLVRLRTDRTHETDTPFVTAEFGLLLGVAIFLAAAGIALAHWQRVAHVAQQPLSVRLLLLAGIVGLSLGGAALLSRLESFQPYLFPFVLWLLLLDLALLMTLFAPGMANSGPSSDQPAPGAPRILTIFVLSFVLPLVMLELGLRFWFSIFGSELDRIAYIYSAEDMSARAFRFRGVPYINFGLSPTYPGHNSLGYRGAEITLSKPDGIYRIVALGGSTTYGELLADWTQSYPAQLQQILRDDYGYEQVEVINSGVPAYNTWDSLVNFQFRVLDLQPDLIIVYHAVNDLGARALPSESYHGIPGSAGIWQDTLDLGPSVLYRYLAVNLGWIRNPNDLHNMVRAYEQAGRDCCANLTHEEMAARFQANPPIYFERNLRSLIAVAQAHNVQMLLSSWAYFPDPTDGDWNLQALPYRQQALAQHNAIIERLAQETGAAFYDLFANFPYNRDFWFVDGMHMTAAGTAEQAHQYAAFLDAGQFIPQPR